ncbi:MAG: CapA family protein [Desulfobacula sp.]|uniref:CapA family protein n=1 Tax=Desulfobacula sp. TaxID=2593537 RepID=UPI0025C5D5BE|nr:CapA family protein [Desulfobacula sp.]MCD4718245.1 CapA family protein [Desulfobacula sp.]
MAKICIAGDWAPIRVFKKIMDTRPESIYGDLLPILRSVDLSIVNLESPLSDRGDAAIKSGAVFKGKQRHIKALKAVPFDVVTLANNHVFDYGIDAFKDTMDILNHHHLQWTGAGMSIEEACTPLVINVNDIKIAIVNFSEGEDLTSAGKEPGVMGWDLPKIEDTIKSLRPKVDFIIAVSHCGIEYIPFPPPYVAKAFKQMARAGADIVIGHHPHVPQGIQFYNNIPIIYSLGNFVFYQQTDLYYRKLGYLVNLKLNKDSLVSLELIPYEIHDSGLSLLIETELHAFWKKFKEISLPLHDDKKLEEAWHGFLHYYGINGFFNEISMITKKIKTDPQKGAAMFRNRLTTLQHYHHWKDFMTHLVEGKLESSPQWSRSLIDEWLTCKTDGFKLKE